MKKISELTETTSLSTPIYAPVTKGDGETEKYNLQKLDTSKYDNILGDIEDYDATKIYYTGKILRYNGKIYKVLENYYANGVDIVWEETTLMTEITGNTQILTVQINFSDNLLSNSGIPVVVSFSDNSSSMTSNTNNSGKAQFSILKGKIYDVEVGDIQGYSVQKYENLKAISTKQQINILYTKDITTCNLEVYIITKGSGGNVSDFEGQLFKITKGTEIRTATVTNGKATFTGLQKNTTYILNNTYLDSNSGTYRRPEDKTIITKLDVNKVNVEYTKTNYGLFAVDNNDNEIELTQEFIDTLGSEDKETYKAIHVNPETLAKNGCDYYVRCKDLTSERTITTKTWGTYGKTLPNVSTNTSTEYRGKLMTYYMIKDERTVSPISKSNAAEYATTQEYTRGGGKC